MEMEGFTSQQRDCRFHVVGEEEDEDRIWDLTPRKAVDLEKSNDVPLILEGSDNLRPEDVYNDPPMLPNEDDITGAWNPENIEGSDDDDIQMEEIEGQGGTKLPFKKRPSIQSSKAVRLKRDPIWQEFIARDDGRADCKYCNQTVSGRPPRLKQHLANCGEKLSQRKTKTVISSAVNNTKVRIPVSGSKPGLAVASGNQNPIAGGIRPKMSSFVDKMTAREKYDLDMELGRMLFECNLSFCLVEHPSFKNFMKKLRPSYTLPAAKTIGSSILDKVYEEEVAQMKIDLEGKEVSIMQDGWSTSQNSAVIAHCLSTGPATYFLNAFEPGVERKTAENCAKWLEQANSEAEETFGCKPFAVVSDNCATMVCMRGKLKLPSYGCHSHLLNLLAEKLTDVDIVNAVKTVQKYFRNHHFESAALKKLGGQRPMLPGATRWNSLLDCIKSYLANRIKYLEIAELPDAEVPDKISEIITTHEITTEMKKLQTTLEPVCNSLDRLQSDNATLAEGVQEWLHLEQKINDEINRSESMKEWFYNYQSQAIPPLAAAAYMLHPVYRGLFNLGKDLTPDLAELGRMWLGDKDPSFVAGYTALKSEDTSFYPPSLLNIQVAALMSPSNWWNEASSWPGISRSFSTLAQQLMKLPATSAGIERCFSTLSNIMTKKRNRLGVRKALKLCTIYCNNSLRNKNAFDVQFEEVD